MPNDFPIVLCHGIARFDELRQQLIARLVRLGAVIPPTVDATHYFKGVASHLIAQGLDTHHSSVEFAAGVEERAADLREAVEDVLRRTRRSKVHLIAHSMGGLDARHMIVDHGMADRVASLTTIGTPHCGTNLADWGLRHFGHALIESLRDVVHLEGFADLTTDACRDFNARAEAPEATNEVFYQTYASHERRLLIFAPLRGAWELISNSAGIGGGDNDGLVPRASQHWQAVLRGDDGRISKPVAQHDFPFSADHLNQVGWFDPAQFREMPLFTLNPIKFMLDYERKVRDVYSGIAASVRAL